MSFQAARSDENRTRRNPITKGPRNVARWPDGRPAMSFHAPGFGRWVGTCEDCGERTRGAPSRKVAKDRLYQHRKAAH